MASPNFSIPVSIDGHAINDGVDYVASQVYSTGLPSLTPRMVKRDGASSIIGRVSVAERTLPVLQITVENSGSFATQELKDANYNKLVLQLHQWFSTPTPVPYIISDPDGSNPRYSSVICTRFESKPSTANHIFHATLQVDGLVDKDYRFRRTTPNTDTWSVNSSPSTKTVTNNGHDKAFPILKIKPTSASASGYSHKVWAGVRWRLGEGYTHYPMDIVNASFDSRVAATNVEQADGDDIRVEANGSEIDRWLDAPNTASTKIWCNLTFQAKVELTTTAVIAASGNVDTIDFNEDITNLPDSGILVIDSEVFVYTSKNNSLKRVLGVTRASRNSSMATHSGGATVWWAQHDIWILYGNASIGAPTVDDDTKPAFNLTTSTNTSWDYDEFGDDNGFRTGSWQSVIYDYSPDSNPSTYTGNTEYTNASPWEKMGMVSDTGVTSSVRWFLHNPCGITNANFQNGRSFYYSRTRQAVVESSADYNESYWTIGYSIPYGTASTWENWSWSGALVADAEYVRMRLYVAATQSANPFTLEIADVTLTLDSANVPTTTLYTEQGNYSLDCIIENEATGDQIALQYPLELNESLNVNTDLKMITYSLDDSSQFQALSLVGGARMEWLPLVVGSNPLKFTQINTGNVTIDIEWEERSYF